MTCRLKSDRGNSAVHPCSLREVLRAIPKAMVDKSGQEVIEVGSHRRGIVEELEKAHIYIEQMHKHINEQTEQNKVQSAQIKELTERLAKLETKDNVVK